MHVGTNLPRTRHQIMSLLKTGGDQDATTLARELDISAMAVRQHLYELRNEGLVTYKESARPVGRPAKLWKLTRQADMFFPNGHADFAVGLIGAVRSAFGDSGMDRLLAARADQQVATYRHTVRPSDTLRRRLEALARLRSVEGYMATVEPAGRGRYLFVENH